MNRTQAKIVKIPSTVPIAPESLPEAGKAEWRKVAPVLVARGSLSAEIEGLLENYCSQIAMIRNIDEALKSEPMLITGANGVSRPHPLLGSKNKAVQTSTQLAKRLGLIGAVAPKKAPSGQDPYAELGII